MYNKIFFLTSLPPYREGRGGSPFLKQSSLSHKDEKDITNHKTCDTHDETCADHLLLLDKTSSMSKGIWRSRDWEYHCEA